MNILTSKTIDKGNSPKDITIIRKMFDSLGIEEYEKNTLNYMSEFINSYIIDILKESKKNMILSGREKINIEDVELAVKNKQKLMYQNRPPISKMKELADKLNANQLPLIPESPNVLMPPIENNLLRNNFQIYSDELNQALLDEGNKNIIESSSLRPDDLNMLGNKRKYNAGNDSKNNLNSDIKFGGFQKKKRKISLNQAFKKTSQENAKKENMMSINENNNNIKINMNDTKKSSKLNSINNDNNDDDIDFDNDDDNEMENNNNVDSTNNIKDEDDDGLKMDDDENGDDDAEGEEMEGDNDNENDNESNNEGNESYSDKEDEKISDKKNKEDNKFRFIHDDEDEEDDYGDGF